MVKINNPYAAEAEVGKKKQKQKKNNTLRLPII